MTIPGAAEGLSSGANDLVLDEKGLEDDATECRWGRGRGVGVGDFGVIADNARLLCDRTEVHGRDTLATAESEGEVTSLVEAENTGRNDMLSWRDYDVEQDDWREMRSPDLDLNGVNFRRPFQHAMHFRADVGYAYKNDTRSVERL